MFGFIFTAVALFILNHYDMVDLVLRDYLLLPFVVFIYSQLPDLDTQASKIRWVLTIGLLLTALYFMYVANIRLAMASIVASLIMWCMHLMKGFGHRGITHTLIANIVLSLPLLMLSLPLFISGMASYQSHMFADNKFIEWMFGGTKR